MVSWGIKCAVPGIPGTYAKLTNFGDEIKCKIEVMYGNKDYTECPQTDLSQFEDN